jgi:hypothetical protein
MFRAYICVGFLVTAIFVLSDVVATSRFWALSDVRFNDRTYATG